MAEAHAYAVVASETIDIPLCGSDALLRHASRIPQYDLTTSTSQASDDLDELDPAQAKNLMTMDGPLQIFCDRASPINRAIVLGLCSRLKIELTGNVSTVFDEYATASREYRAARRGGFPRRGRGGFSRRRELREAIVEKWPELAEQDKWPQLEMLQGDAGAKFAQELKDMPGYMAYVTSRDERLKLAMPALKPRCGKCACGACFTRSSP